MSLRILCFLAPVSMRMFAFMLLSASSALTMQERLKISEDGDRIAKVKEAFAAAVQQEFKRLMAAGGITANEAANLAMKHAAAQLHQA